MLFALVIDLPSIHKDDASGAQFNCGVKMISICINTWLNLREPTAFAPMLLVSDRWSQGRHM